MKNEQRIGIKLIGAGLFCLLLLGLLRWIIPAGAVPGDGEAGLSRQSEQAIQPEEEPKSAKEAKKAVEELYEEYQKNFEAIEYRWDIPTHGFSVIEEHIFPLEMKTFGEVMVIPAFHQEYNRLALFFSEANGRIVYKTEQLETNNRNRGELKQLTEGIAAISFKDLNEDGSMDIVLITSFVNETGEYAGTSYKVGDVLFQDKEGGGFYRDYRITDKLNRFSMNKSADLIAAFVRDGYSTEFMYTAATLDELLKEGLVIIQEQSYPRNFEKLGRLQVIPGTYRIADYDVFMIYLVNEEGYIVSSLQPMEDYDNLYALLGVSCWDIDGDGLKDIAVLARYSYEGSNHELVVKTDYSIYYQRTGGFTEDMQIKESYKCTEDETMENLVRQGRAYWGWKREE